MLPGSRALIRFLRRRAEPPPFPLKARTRLRMLVEEIEPRILHSADLVPGLYADTAGAQIEIRIAESNPAPATVAASAQERQTRELVVIDPATSDYQVLVDDIVSQAEASRSFEIMVLEADRD